MQTRFGKLHKTKPQKHVGFTSVFARKRQPKFPCVTFLQTTSSSDFFAAKMKLQFRLDLPQISLALAKGGASFGIGQEITPLVSLHVVDLSLVIMTFVDESLKVVIHCPCHLTQEGGFFCGIIDAHRHQN
jgi:hypothetical protein